MNWAILIVLATISLFVYRSKRGAVWGGLTLGAIVGLLISIVGLIKGKEFSSAYVWKGAVLGTIIGLCAEMLGKLVDYLKGKKKANDPEIIAAALFKVMENRHGMDEIVDSFSERFRDKIALELKILSLFSRSCGCMYGIQSKEKAREVIKGIYSFFPSRSQAYFGLPFDDIEQVLQERIAKYSEVFDQSDLENRAWEIGKAFAEFCGLEGSAKTAEAGLIWSKKEIEATMDGLRIMGE